MTFYNRSKQGKGSKMRCNWTQQYNEESFDKNAFFSQASKRPIFYRKTMQAGKRRDLKKNLLKESREDGEGVQ